MALTLNAGSGGSDLATDAIGDDHYQEVKPKFGADGTATDVSVNNGAADAGTQRVTVASNSTGVLSVDDNDAALTVDWAGTAPPIGAGTEAAALRVTVATDSTGVLTVDGTVTANLSATDNAVLDSAVTALQIMDDWDESDRAKVNPIVGQAGVAAGAGAVGVTVPRTTLASDDPAVVALQVIDDWDESDRAKVNPIAGQAGVQGGTGVDTALTQRVSLATDIPLPAGTNEIGKLAAGTAAIGKLAANNGVDIGDVDVTSISAGSNLVGDVGISGARTSGGTTLYKNIDVDESEDQVKGTAGQVYWIHAINLKASVLYLKFYNVAAASVTVGTTVPDMTFPIPTQGDTNGAGFTLSIPNGIAFGTAITIACTTGIADNDSGAPGANECVVNLGYA